MRHDEDMTIPSLTRHDTIKARLYVFFGLLIAFGLIAGTIWLFTSS